MKKLLYLLSAIVFFSSCVDDGNSDDDDNNGYPTDNLSLPEQKDALMLINYALGNGASVPMEFTRIGLAAEFGRDLNTVNLSLPSPGSPIASAAALELATGFGIATNNGTVVNGIPVDFTDDIPSLISNQILNGKPIVTVNHKVTKNDTAWLVDCKVKFWKDTVAANRFKIESYWLANLPGINYTQLGIDLRAPAVTDLIDRQDSLSLWLNPFFSFIDSTQQTSAGELFEHKNVMLAQANPNDSFGVFVADYTPFGANFFENDVIGTRSTPIRHYFLRPNQDTDPDNDIEVEYTPVFLTVVWSVDPATGDIEHLNSVMSTSTP